VENVVVIVISLLLPFQAPELGAATLDDLAASLETAFAENDVDRFMSLHFWDDCPEIFKENQLRAFSVMRPMGIDIHDVVDVDPDKRKKLAEGIVYADRKRYVHNLQPVKLFLVSHGERSEGEFPVGVHNGRYFLCMFRPEGS